MQTYKIPANRRIQVFKMLSFKGKAETVDVDFSAWADDNGTVSGVTATVKSGQISIGNESFASNVKTMVLTASEQGISMIKLVATAGNNLEPVYLKILAKDPYTETSDYGLFV